MSSAAANPIALGKVSEQRSAGKPVVSVAMLTYNHEQFIGKAIESVLQQETGFPLELIIGEDCSTDNTRCIVQKYASRHPNIIRPLLPDHNLGMQENLSRVLGACRGKYVALLEGDDYWVCPRKLQEQVGILEANPHFSLCGGKTEIIISSQGNPDRVIHIIRPGRNKPSYGMEDFLLEKPMHLSSVLFRANYVVDPDWLKQVVIRDYCKFAILTEKGPAGFINQVISRYRLHAHGVWSSMSISQQLRQQMEALDLLDAHFQKKYHSLMMRAQVSHAWKATIQLTLNGCWKESRTIFQTYGKKYVRDMPVRVALWAAGVYGGLMFYTWWFKSTRLVAQWLRIKKSPVYLDAGRIALKS